MLPSAKTGILLNAKTTGLDTTQDEINWRWRLSTRCQAVVGTKVAEKNAFSGPWREQLRRLRSDSPC